MFTPGPTYPGFYIGAEGGLNWLLNNNSYQMDTGWAAGGKVGYDFVGPRLELEGIYRQNNGSGTVAYSNGTFANRYGTINQVSVMANALYDFFAGAGVAFVDPSISSGCTMCSTQFAYQGIVGIGYNLAPGWRLDLDGRYYGTTNPGQYNNNNFSVMMGLTYKFGQPDTAPAAPPPPPATAAAPSFMVFFDWDKSDLNAQSIDTIQRAAAAYRTKGGAQIKATGHTDRSGPEVYNMALSLRRANAVKDALVQAGVRESDISVVGLGESQPLVPTADGVREAQNRRVEIVMR
jgi:OmpA-OmpF porin, OOP family